MLHRFLSAAFVAAFAFGAQAQVIDPQTAWNAAYDARTDGPVDVPLGDQAVFHMADDLFFIPKTEATTLMKAWGNQVDPSFYGLIAPKDNNQPWIVSVKYIREGYVKDEDAASWDKDEMLESFKQGTLEHNKELLEMGMPGLIVTGWVEEPAYDKANHRLVWSLAADEIGAPADAPATINYNTYALGREGYFEINLLTSDQTIATDKAYAQEILTSVQYNDGKRYEDYTAGDNVAAYGLMALVGGGLVAKKLGLIAVVGLFLAKFAKLLIIGGVVALGGVAKIFGGRKNS